MKNSVPFFRLELPTADVDGGTGVVAAAAAAAVEAAAVFFGVSFFVFFFDAEAGNDAEDEVGCDVMAMTKSHAFAP